MDTKEMSRMEIYFELAKHVHQDHYKQIITWKTEHLKSLLDWFERPPEIKITYVLSRKAQRLLLSRIGV